jgi:Ca2+-binding RTX toxin-like protein
VLLAISFVRCIDKDNVVSPALAIPGLIPEKKTSGQPNTDDGNYDFAREGGIKFQPTVGSIFFNFTNFQFNTPQGYDLYTVAKHEIAHLLGIYNNTRIDPRSPSGQIRNAYVQLTDRPTKTFRGFNSKAVNAGIVVPVASNTGGTALDHIAYGTTSKLVSQISPPVSNNPIEVLMVPGYAPGTTLLSKGITKLDLAVLADVGYTINGFTNLNLNNPKATNPGVTSGFIAAGTPSADTISGDIGNDYLAGGPGNDTLKGNKGNDSLYGGDGNDSLLGGDNNDRLDGGKGSDKLEGGKGDDLYFVDSTSDVVVETANQGKDQIDSSKASAAVQTYFKKPANRANVEIAWYQDPLSNFYIATDDTNSNFDLSNFITLNNIDPLLIASTSIYGLGGLDTLTGGSGAETIYGGAGIDSISGGAGNDFIYGDSNGDSEQPTSGDDTLSGDVGDDTIYGDNGDDYIMGGDGNDQIQGEFPGPLQGTGKDTIDGGNGNDTLYGNANDDYIIGGAGDDYIGGQDGNDSLEGGAGNNTLFGGVGEDTFSLASDGVQIISDFVDETDRINAGAVGGFISLTFQQNGPDVNISQNGQNLAIVKGITEDKLTKRDFMEIEYVSVDLNSALFETYVAPKYTYAWVGVRTGMGNDYYDVFGLPTGVYPGHIFYSGDSVSLSTGGFVFLQEPITGSSGKWFANPYFTPPTIISNSQYGISVKVGNGDPINIPSHMSSSTSVYLNHQFDGYGSQISLGSPMSGYEVSAIAANISFT